MTRRARRLSGVLVFAALGAVIFLFAITEHVIEAPGGNLFNRAITNLKEAVAGNPRVDIEPQQPLSNPPKIIKAIYATNWSASSEKKIQYFLDLLDTTELNAIVIDIKDYTGVVAWQQRVPRMNVLIKRFHDHGVYVIGRIAVFQDVELVQRRPDLALHSSSTGAIWGDRKGVQWLDTASTEVWDYNIEIAREALDRGFDEINFDYIRFASDGNVADIQYPFYDGVTPRHQIVKNFFVYVREKLPGAKLSADLFGEVTYKAGDIGIGQQLEDAFLTFDVVSPMTYPSHYSAGFNGFANPAEAPYEVVRYSMESAVRRARQFELTLPTSTPMTATFRPWLQDFDLGADYDSAKVRAQIRALDDVIGSSTYITGFMLWSPSNVYTREALSAQ